MRLANGYYGSLTRSHRYPIDLMTSSERERLPGFPAWSLYVFYEIPLTSACFYGMFCCYWWYIYILGSLLPARVCMGSSMPPSQSNLTGIVKRNYIIYYVPKHCDTLIFAISLVSVDRLFSQLQSEITSAFIWNKCSKLISLKLSVRVTFIPLKLQISFSQDSWQNIGERPYVFKIVLKFKDKTK